MNDRDWFSERQASRLAVFVLRPISAAIVASARVAALPAFN
jgi:hypothetical protein